MNDKWPPPPDWVHFALVGISVALFLVGSLVGARPGLILCLFGWLVIIMAFTRYALRAFAKRPSP